MQSSEQNLSRRPLEFQDLGEVIRDVESLHAGGYGRAGNWDLAQTCGHLADWMRYPLDGFPRAPLPVRAILWGLRNTVGPRKLRQTIERGSMPAGLPTVPESVPEPGEDEAEAVERLRQTIARFEAHDGPLHPSPMFGSVDRETSRRMQLLHCAHHLGFLLPKRA